MYAFFYRMYSDSEYPIVMFLTITVTSTCDSMLSRRMLCIWSQILKTWDEGGSELVQVDKMLQAKSHLSVMCSTDSLLCPRSTHRCGPIHPHFCRLSDVSTAFFTGNRRKILILHGQHTDQITFCIA